MAKLYNKYLSLNRILQKISENKFYYILTVFATGLIVLWPSFKLSLTGDDYLSLWRFDWSLYISDLNYNYITFWLTDYGPQDTTVAIIHHLVGFKPLLYYIISYLLRVLAAVSLFPLVNHLTKNKVAALISSLFFIISAVGLETTNWVFNMPSYLGIALLNLFILRYLIDVNNKKVSLITITLFILTIISQPIRLSFIPAFVLFLEIYLMIKKINNFRIAFFRIILFGTLFFGVIQFTQIGNTQLGISDLKNKDRLWTNNINYIFSAFSTSEDFKFLLTPFSYLGTYIPTNITTRFQIIDSRKELLFLTVAVYFSITIVQLFSSLYLRTRKGFTKLTIFLYSLWTLLVTLIYYNSSLPLQLSSYFPVLVGGHIFIYVLFFYLTLKKFELKLGVFIFASIVFLTTSYLWVKSPLQVYGTHSRYLIVPSVSLSIFLGLYYVKTKNKSLLQLLLLGFFLLHACLSFSYLFRLSKVRAAGFTEEIRNSIPYNPKFKDEKQVLVYYFSTNNESVLYHSLLFGFPIIMKYKHGVNNPWRLVYTSDWNEVVSAYTDGKSVKRFTNKEEVVDIENIYSFELNDHQLTENTQAIRDKLSKIEK